MKTRIYAAPAVKGLKQLGRYASLNYNIYIVADPTPVDVDHAAHACHCIVLPQCLHRKNKNCHFFLNNIYKYREKHNFIYKNTTIEIVDHFKYDLGHGVICNFNNSFVKHKEHLFHQANKAMFALLRRTDS